jgi:hypothetical protein
VDEFGRDLGLQRRQELQRGAGRRQSLVAGMLAHIAALQQGEHGQARAGQSFWIGGSAVQRAPAIRCRAEDWCPVNEQRRVWV